jgi:TonB family protein
MKTIISILVLFFIAGFSVNAQNNKGHDEVFLVVENMPEYPGGKDALRKDIAETVKYPEEAKKQKITGKVFVSFVVNKQGKVEDVKIERGVNTLLDQEAMRVVKQLKTWKPGSQKGVKVKVRFTVPIQFALS